MSAILPIIVVLLFGAIAVLLVGVVGGPIKVETPIVMTVLHLIGFALWVSDWPLEALGTYLGLLMACVAVQVAVGLDLFKPDKRLPEWLARGLLAAAYAGMIALLVVQA